MNRTLTVRKPEVTVASGANVDSASGQATGEGRLQTGERAFKALRRLLEDAPRSVPVYPEYISGIKELECCCP